ncbi:MAG TPA: hypothetical protein VNS57_06265 [Steroidobacteraceae bacterium]|nr:hypothetical protein [Steroidobacteraceae bacterium]
MSTELLHGFAAPSGPRAGTPEDHSTEKSSILGRAAITEAELLCARSCGNRAGEFAALAELRQLWQRYMAADRVP